MFPCKVALYIVNDIDIIAFLICCCKYDGAELVVAPQYATEHIRSAGKITEDGDITFQVRIKRDCEEDDLEADK